MNRYGCLLAAMLGGASGAMPGCDRISRNGGGPAPPPPYEITFPPGWKVVPGKGIGPLMSCYHPQTYGDFRANIQVFVEQVDDPDEPSDVLSAFWYEGTDRRNVMTSFRLQPGKKVDVPGADQAAVYQGQATYGIYKLIQKKLVATRGNKRYVVTCSALRSNFAGYESRFDDVLASFRFPAAKTQPAETQPAKPGKPASAKRPESRASQ